MGITDRIIQKLGKKDYKVDEALSGKETIIILSEKMICLLRGFWYRLFFRQCGGYLFVGKRCKIRHCHKISTGRTIQIGDHVEINALSKKGIQMGNNVSIHRNTIIECTGVIRNLGEGLVIGNNVGIAQNCFIQVRGNVTIGNDVMFGPGVSVFSEEHGFDQPDIPMIDQPETRKDVVIGNNVWIGTRAIILGGVTVGEGSVIAAGAVVRESVPAFSVVAGVPAKIIRSRK